MTQLQPAPSSRQNQNNETSQQSLKPQVADSSPMAEPTSEPVPEGWPAVDGYSTQVHQHPVLDIQNLAFAYPGHAPVLDQLSCVIHPHEKVGIIGPNGAGKTSLFMLICGLLPMTSGAIRLFNRPVVAGEFRPELGLVFQNPDDQLFSATVAADVAFGPENMGLPPEEVAARTEAALHLTGMLDHQHRAPHHLSGGEKRMVAIASVLSMLPDLVIYDEPSANLDLRARRRLIQFLHNSQETLLISSHDLEFLLEVCDRVLLLDKGHIIADDVPQAIMGDEDLMLAHGLEKPHSLIPHRHLNV